MSSVVKLPAQVLKSLETRLGVRSKVSHLFLYDLFTSLRYEYIDAQKSKDDRAVPFSIDDLAEFYYYFHCDKNFYESFEHFIALWRKFINGIPKAGVLAITDEGNVVLVLMIKKLADGNDEAVLGFPKGKRSCYDDNLKETGYREMFEETGINLSSDGVKRVIHQTEANLTMFVESNVESSLVDESFSQEYETNGVRTFKANELYGVNYVPVVFEGKELQARLAKTVINLFSMINEDEELEDIKRICLIE